MQRILHSKGGAATGFLESPNGMQTIKPVYSKTLQAPLSMKFINNDYLLKKTGRLTYAASVTCMKA